MFIKRFPLKHGIGADLIFSRYIYGTEKLCHKGTLYRVYRKALSDLDARKFRAANIVRFGGTVNDVLQKWPFISVMLSHFENQII